MSGSKSHYFKFAFLMLASFALLASCFISDNKIKNYKIDDTKPAQLPTYSAGHYINFSYGMYTAANNSQSTQGGIHQSWSLSAPLQPPTGEARADLLRHEITESSVYGGEKTSAQYIKQNSTGSIFVHAFQGPTLNKSYWPDAVLGTEPQYIQAFWSPIDATAIDINQAANKAMDFDVVNCDVSGCQSLATFTFSIYRIKKDIEPVTTPLGKFDTYHLEYSGIMVTKPNFSISYYFDYRASCGSQVGVDTVTFSGSVWIYPPIGPVKMDNNCFSSVGKIPVYYFADISQTNLPY